MEKIKTDPDAPPDSFISLIESFDNFEQDIIRLKAIEQSAIDFVNQHNACSVIIQSPFEPIPNNDTWHQHETACGLAYQNLKELLPNE